MHEYTGFPDGGPDPDAPPWDDNRLREVDLGALADKGIKPPELICDGLLYKGATHCIAGQPGGGKTTIMAWWVLQYIRDGGRAILLDEESGEDLMTEKLLDLGAKPDEIRSPRLTYFPFPAMCWNSGDIAALQERLKTRRPGIVAWDSAAEFLTIAGKDENSAADVTWFWKQVLKPCARDFGAAVVITDHTGKGEHGGYGRGSGAKKAASDVQFIAETEVAFNRHQDGLIKLTTSPGKDRRGHLAAAYDVQVLAGPPLELEFSENTPTGTSGIKWTPAMTKLAAVLTPEPSTRNQLVDKVKAAYGHGLTKKTVGEALKRLLQAGVADQLDLGPGREDLWSKTP